MFTKQCAIVKHMAPPQIHQLAPLASKVLAIVFARLQSHREDLVVDQSTLVHNYVCKNEQQLLERLDQATLDVMHNPKKTQKTACIGTLL